MNTLRSLFLFLFLTGANFCWSQKIGWLLDSYVIDRWYKDDKYFEERIKQLGGECLKEVARGDGDEQVRLGLKLIDSGVDALVIVPVDALKSAKIVEAAKKAGIPVIAYDRLIDSKDLAFYISYDNSAVGHLQAGYALKKVPQGNYLLINGPVHDNNAILYREGQMSVLKPAIAAGKIKIIGDFILNNWSEMEAMMKMQEFFLTGNPKPDAIIAANDAIATGTIQTLSKDLLGKVVITGQDADILSLKYIVEGSQSMTIYKPIKPLAYMAAEITMKIVKKQPLENTITIKKGDIEVPAVLLKPIAVDSTNYRETVVKDGHVQLSDIEQK